MGSTDYAGCMALVRILAFLEFSEKLLEGSEQNDMLCLVLKGSLWLPSGEQTSQEWTATRQRADGGSSQGAGCVEVVRSGQALEQS